MRVVGVWRCEFDGCGTVEALVFDHGNVHAVQLCPGEPPRCDCWTGGAGLGCGHPAAVAATLAEEARQ